MSDWQEHLIYREGYRRGFEDAKKRIVHCEECRYWVEETHGCTRNPSTEAWYDGDYCSYGAKRGDSDE